MSECEKCHGMHRVECPKCHDGVKAAMDMGSFVTVHIAAARERLENGSFRIMN